MPAIRSLGTAHCSQGGVWGFLVMLVSWHGSYSPLSTSIGTGSLLSILPTFSVGAAERNAHCGAAGWPRKGPPFKAKGRQYAAHSSIHYRVWRGFHSARLLSTPMSTPMKSVQRPRAFSFLARIVSLSTRFGVALELNLG